MMELALVHQAKHSLKSKVHRVDRVDCLEDLMAMVRTALFGFAFSCGHVIDYAVCFDCIF